MRVFFCIVVVLLGLAIGSSIYLSRPIFDEMLDKPPVKSLAIAPVGQAITFARSRDGTPLLVTSANAEGVSVIDINQLLASSYADGAQAYRELGYERLLKVRESAHIMARLSWSDLGLPVATGAANIAAGANYSAHADEVGHEGLPFLFPKLSAPVTWDSNVTQGYRLDYEVELCAIPLSDYVEGAEPELGYLLCNDFTDRWLLVRDIDQDGPMGLTGFAFGKGGETRLPLGPFLVIPQDTEFYQHLELSLYVDGELRQKTSADSMIWKPADILERALRGCRQLYQLPEGSVPLTVCNRIPAGTVVLTGTPAGVMFNVATIWAPWAYLRPGQRILSYGTYLGSLDNSVVAQ